MKYVIYSFWVSEWKEYPNIEEKRKPKHKSEARVNSEVKIERRHLRNVWCSYIERQEWMKLSFAISNVLTIVDWKLHDGLKFSVKIMTDLAFTTDRLCLTSGTNDTHDRTKRKNMQSNVPDSAMT